MLIVVGVSLAFGVESRWSDYQEAREDAGYIAALAAEFLDDRADLEGALRLARGAAAAADTLRMVRLGDVAVPSSRIPYLFWLATSVNQLGITSTSLESLFTSPTWARLNNPELQLTITQHDQSLRELQTTIDRATDYWFQSFEPVLRDRIDYHEWEGRFSRPDDAASAEELAGWVRLLDERDVNNLLTHAEWFAREVEGDVSALLSQIDHIMELLSLTE
jgi:hypothetical protein